VRVGGADGVNMTKEIPWGVNITFENSTGWGASKKILPCRGYICYWNCTMHMP